MNVQRLAEPLYWVGARRMATAFPPLEQALADPNGLIAIGGDLSPTRLLDAYRHGIFPWYSPGQPILWWSPDPRTVLTPDTLHISRSLAKRVRNGGFTLAFDRDFAAVIDACAAPRAHDVGTWITAEMRDAYLELHRRGHAHAIECRLDGELVGGLYGVALGRVFFGESMFARVRDASKVALAQLCAWLVEWGYELVDCQVHTTHLASLGAREMPRAQFAARVAELVATPPAAHAWRALEHSP